MSGVKKTVVTNLAGVLCGITIITLSKFSPMFGNLGIWCGIITFVMCIIAKSEWFDFCPGTFMGCFMYQAVTEKKECDTYMGENVLQSAQDRTL